MATQQIETQYDVEALNETVGTASQQLPNEPDKAYTRFLIYLHLGPSRSVEASYGKYLESHPDVRKATKTSKRHRSGQWERDCRTYRWKERSNKYDIAFLKTIVPASMVRILHNVDQLALTTLRALESGKFKPETWDDLTHSIAFLSSLMTPEVITSLMSDHIAEDINGGPNEIPH